MVIDYEVRAHSRLARRSLSADCDERAGQAADWWYYSKHCGDERLASVWRTVYWRARRESGIRRNGEPKRNH